MGDAAMSYFVGLQEHSTRLPQRAMQYKAKGMKLITFSLFCNEEEIFGNVITFDTIFTIHFSKALSQF